MYLLSKIIYNFGIRLYYIVALVLQFFNQKARFWVQGRKAEIKTIAEKSVWFHCASLGEFEQAKPLILAIKKEFPAHKIVLTFYSPSGYEIRKNYSEADFVYYLPIDTAQNAKNFIAKIKPEMVFFIKYEFWFHYLKELKKQKINTYLVSGIFRANQIFFKSYASFFKEMLTCFTHFFVQDDTSVALLKTLEINNTSQANDTRFDTVIQTKNASRDFENIANFVLEKKCIVLGSSWLEDEKLFSEASFQKEYKYIIAPHNITAKRILEVQKLFPNNVLYSELKAQNSQKQVLIIDNIGMLSSIYKYGQIAYIGGGFGVSIHNILEAAVFTMPVLFGPAHTKMKEAADLIKLKAAFEINKLSDLEQCIKMLKDEQKLVKHSQRAGEYVSTNSGGTEKIIHFIKKSRKFG